MPAPFLQLDLFASPHVPSPEIAEPVSTDARTFYLGPVDRAAAPYLHIIRASGDPERSPRGPGRALLWKGLDRHTAEEWAARIVAHLGDGIPRTFNRIMVELSDFTADVAYGSNADEGLWLAVSLHQLALTYDAPILFTCTDGLVPVT